MNKSAFLRPLLALLISLFSIAAAAAPVDDYYEDALTRYNAQDYKGAVIQLKNALKEDPRHLPSRILMGQSLVHVNDPETAEKYLRSALASGADEALVAVPLASAYLMQGKLEQLLKEIRSGSRATRVEMEVLMLRGQALLQLNRPAEAMDAFKRAGRLLPQDPGPLLGMATVEMLQGHLKKAAALVDRAEQLAPGSADIYYAKGEIARLNGDPEQAARLFDQAIAQVPDYIEARKKRAAVLMTLGRDQAARKDVDFILDASADDLQGIYLKAMLLARQGKYKQALGEIQGIRQMLSNVSLGFLQNHAPTLLLMGTLEYLQGDLGQARRHLKRYLEIHPNHLQPRLVLAEILIRQKDNLGAAALLRPMLVQYPDNVDLLALLGTAYLNDRHFAEAREYLQKASRLDPQRSAVLARLALSKMGAGEQTAAMEDLQQILQGDAGKAVPGMMLAMLQLRRKAYPEALETIARLEKEGAVTPLLYNLKAAALLGRQELDGARQAFQKALKLNPDYVPAQLNLAALDLSQGRFEQAARGYRQILRRHPNQPLAMAGLAKTAEARGNRREAIDWLEKLRNSERSEAIAPQLLQLARLYLAGRQPEKALDAAKELERVITGNADLMELLGRIHLALHENQEAARYLRVTYQSSRDNPARLVRAARLLIEAGDLPAAAKAVAAALEADPGYLPARETEVQLAIRQGQQERARALARQLRKDFPRQAAGGRILGDLLMRSGDYLAAVQAYRDALQRAPESGLMSRLFRALLQAGESREAVAQARQWLAEHPDDVQVHHLLALLFSRSGKLSAAQPHYQAMARLQPDNALIQNELADFYLRSNRLDDALRQARRAYSLNDRHPAVIDTLGWTLVRKNQNEEGLKYLRQAHARAADQPVVRYHLAVALHRLGRNSEARQELEAALHSKRPFPDQADARALLQQLRG